MVDGNLFPYKGKITFADPSYNSTTGTFLLRATVDNPAGVLRPNQYVRARLSGAVRPAAIVVPQRAVQQGAKGHFVWVIDAQNRAELRPVSVGDWYGGNGWIVTEGVAAGDLVVVDGGTRLTAGAKVASKPYVAPAPAQMRPQAASAAKPEPAGSAAAVAAVRFATGAAALDADALRTLREAAASLMSMGTAITITGYADASGDHAANVDLAKRRATMVRDALVTNGVDPRRLRLAAPKEVTGSGTADEARRVDIGLGQ